MKYSVIIVFLFLFISITRAEMVANWTFEEGFGGVATDYALSNDCEIINATWTIGVKDNALNFNGIDSYLNCGNSSSLNFGTGNFTIMAWVKINDLQDGNIVNKYSSSEDPYMFYSMGVSSAPDCWFSVFGEDGGDTVSNNTAYIEGEWIHIVGVREGNTLLLYLNGVFVNEYVTTGIGDVNTNLSLYIGKEENQWFNGTIDEVKVYNTALSPSQISQIYTSEKQSVTYSPTYKEDDIIPIIFDAILSVIVFIITKITIIGSVLVSLLIVILIAKKKSKYIH